MITNTIYKPKTPIPTYQLIGIVSSSALVLTNYLYGRKDLRESQVQLVFNLSSITGDNFKEIVLLHDWRKLQDYKQIHDYITNDLKYVRQE